MNKQYRLKQIEYRIVNGIGSMTENVDQYAQHLVRQNNYRWALWNVIILFVAFIIFLYINK